MVRIHGELQQDGKDSEERGEQDPVLRTVVFIVSEAIEPFRNSDRSNVVVGVLVLPAVLPSAILLPMNLRAGNELVAQLLHETADEPEQLLTHHRNRVLLDQQRRSRDDSDLHPEVARIAPQSVLRKSRLTTSQ